MICTVTFNPSLDYIVSVDDFQLGMTNRTSSELILPGGKGINVSIVLKNLGLDSTTLGYAGASRRRFLPIHDCLVSPEMDDTAIP